jgi:hypothetical protein
MAASKHETALIVVSGVFVLMILGIVTVHGHFSLNADSGSGNTSGDVGKDSAMPGCSAPGPDPIPVRQQTNPSLGALRINHSLYRRPATCGHDRAIVVRDGWDVFANPPSELELY